jgi:hypothetical protein
MTFKAAALIAEIDTAAVKAAYDTIPNLKNAREFSVETVGVDLSGGVAA